MAQTPAFIVFKDHKENFRTSHQYSIINASKSELGKVSKVILENLNKNLVKSLNINQWKNMDSAMNWFNTIENKSRWFFIQLEIVEVYPCISENIPDTAINFSKQHTDKFDENFRIIKHCCKLICIVNIIPEKKDTDSCFDVTMGRYEGVKICELVEIYLISLAANIIDKNNSSLYRDDGLILLRNAN